MKKICLLSGPDKTKYFNNKITKEIKSLIDNPSSMVVIPANPNNSEKNDKHFYGGENTLGVINTFKKIFPKLDNFVLLDSRITKEKGKNALKKADIIYLLGGDPFRQLKYLQDNNFNDIICKSNGLIIGVSAGSMNLAVNSYYSKDEEYPQSIFYKGLGIVDITIDPHFNINNLDQVQEAKNNSKDNKIIGLPNESAVIIVDNNIKFIGINYMFEHGDIIN